MISSSVKFLLNDKLIVIKNPDPNQTLLNYIRTELKKTGTKEGCSEGGCGACTIVLGELVDNKIEYKAINSCIAFVPSLNGKQLIIVEDLVSQNGKLHPVQDAMVKFHGSQCGFCTPGFVMSLFSMFKNNKSLNNELITDSISGNLCRCTGYRPIIDAAKSLNKINKNDQFSKNKNKVIASLHSVDYKKVGLEDYGKSGNYVARQVNTWTRQYLASETENIDEMNKLIEWLPKNIPEDDETSIVHGDFRLDNMIYSNFDVVGVLDWELSTLGHPIADFCYHCLTWRTLPNFHDHAKLKDLGIPNEMQYRDMYSEQTGKDLSRDWEFYMVYSLFKVAAICQGILGRVRDGTAASKHAEERGMNVFPLSKGAWSIVESNF